MTVKAVTKGGRAANLNLSLRKPFYSPKEYAAIAGIHPSTVLDYIHAGTLYAVRISDRVYRIPLASLLNSLYPDEIGEPRFTTTGDLGRAIAEDQRRYAVEPRPKRRTTRSTIRRG